MEKMIVDRIEEEAQGRPYKVVHHVGNRIEVMFYGDNECTRMDIDNVEKHKNVEEEQTKKSWKEEDLSKIKRMKIAELREIALDLEIQPVNMRKSELLSAIERAIKVPR